MIALHDDHLAGPAVVGAGGDGEQDGDQRRADQQASTPR
jgi:hypothetical protein